jgi:hypothetical protein
MLDGGGHGESGMPSQFVFSPEPRGRGIASRIASASLFFVLGAIAATALYPHADANRRFESGGVSDRAVPASTVNAISPQSATLSPREGAEYTGGPIPEPTFAAAQPAVGAAEGLAHDVHPAPTVDGEKMDHTANKAVRKKEYSHRRIGNDNRPYHEQPSYWTAQGYWSPWGAGNQFDRRSQFVWR